MTLFAENREGDNNDNQSEKRKKTAKRWSDAEKAILNRVLDREDYKYEGYIQDLEKELPGRTYHSIQTQLSVLRGERLAAGRAPMPTIPVPESTENYVVVPQILYRADEVAVGIKPSDLKGVNIDIHQRKVILSY
jgi:hypothetical protein